MPTKTKTIIPTREYFEGNQYKIVTTPGFAPGEVLQFKIKNTSLVTLVRSGRLPNNLMKSAVSLFEGKQTQDVSLNGVSSKELQDLMKIIEAFCKDVMVEPTYDEVGEFLTDDMLFAIFNRTTSEAVGLEDFREEGENT